MNKNLPNKVKTDYYKALFRLRNTYGLSENKIKKRMAMYRSVLNAYIGG
jgi:hypothetical protein